MLTKRAQILFDQTMWNQLVKLAKRQQTSVGTLIREAVEKQVANGVDLQKRRKAIEATLAWREKYGKKYTKGKDSTSIIRGMRDERYGEKHLRRLGNY